MITLSIIGWVAFAMSYIAYSWIRWRDPFSLLEFIGISVYPIIYMLVITK